MTGPRPCADRSTSNAGPTTAADAVLASVMEKLLNLERGQDLLLKTLQTTLTRLQQEDVTPIARERQQQQQQRRPHLAAQKQPLSDATVRQLAVDPKSGPPSSDVTRWTLLRMNHQGTCTEQELKELVEFADKKQKDELDRATTPPFERMFWKRFQKGRLEQIIEPVAGVMIVLNAVMIGFLLDQPNANQGPWLAVKCGFAIVFWTELILKACLFGWRNQYCGDRLAGSIFDLFVVLTDTVDILLSFSIENSGASSIIVLRLFRLMRVVRLFRVLKIPIFHDLLAMVQGMKSGTGTLLWSVIFFACFNYLMSLLFRAFFGPDPDYEKGTMNSTALAFYFQSVPRAALTTYRCSFGDCSTKNGVPLLESTEHARSHVASVLLCFLFFVASVGLFNIISAVFLERIVSYEATRKLHSQFQRFQDKGLWYEKVSRFIEIQLQLKEQAEYNTLGKIEHESLKRGAEMRSQKGVKEFSKRAHRFLAATNISKEVMDFSKEILDLSVELDEETKQILTDLDIEPQDCLNLSDVLDAKNSGSVDVMELLSGLRRLRGPLRRSDIVAVDLAVQSLQVKMDEVWDWQRQQQKLLSQARWEV